MGLGLGRGVWCVHTVCSWHWYIIATCLHHREFKLAKLWAIHSQSRPHDHYIHMLWLQRMRNSMHIGTHSRIILGQKVEVAEWGWKVRSSS